MTAAMWQGTILREEPVLFLRDGSTATGRLLFAVDKLVTVTDTSGQTAYEEGVDFVIEADRRTVRLTAGSRIVALDRSELRRPPKSERSYRGADENAPWFLYSEDTFFPDRQPRFTYRHGGWTLPIPQASGELLPMTHRKLNQRETFRLVVFGDSISEGMNATSYIKSPPYLPSYAGLLARYMNERSVANVQMTNVSKAGMCSDWALTNIDRVVKAQPDLVVLAWGMNDASGRRPVAEYVGLLDAMRQAVLKACPQCEFVYVATSWANTEWTYAAPDLYVAYEQALLAEARVGVAVADATAMWGELLKHKSYHSLTGNGLNHPNDFGHRLYADILARTILGS